MRQTEEGTIMLRHSMDTILYLSCDTVYLLAQGIKNPTDGNQNVSNISRVNKFFPFCKSKSYKWVRWLLSYSKENKSSLDDDMRRVLMKIDDAL